MAGNVEVCFPDGSVEVYPLGTAAVVGRALHAEVSIPDARELHPEHVRLEPRRAGCAVVSAAHAQVVVAGQPFTSGELPWGAEVELPGIRLRLVEPTNEGGTAMGVFLSILLLMALGVAGWAWLTQERIVLDLSHNLDAPPILSGEGSCPRSGERARSEGVRLLEAAEAKSDRYAFSPQDGIVAAQFYRQAQACFEDATDAATAQLAARRGAGLEKRIEDDYRTHRIRLERALMDGRKREALAEALHVHRFVQHTEDEYFRWLTSLIQKLGLAIEEEEAA
ncbi:MAG: hypothetical protein AAGF12_07660 [Myxococcota bacterium]